MKISRFYMTLVLICAVAMSTNAFAQTGHAGTVVVPWGDWLVSLLKGSSDIAVIAASTVFAGWLPVFARQFVTDRLLANAVNYALAAVEGAVQGKTLEIKEVNELVGVAAGYVIANGPKTAKWLGDTLRPKIFARLGAAGVVPAGATAEAAGAILALPGKLQPKSSVMRHP